MSLASNVEVSQLIITAWLRWAGWIGTYQVPKTRESLSVSIDVIFCKGPFKDRTNQAGLYTYPEKTLIHG
jgi:hypothetical protein